MTSEELQDSLSSLTDDAIGAMRDALENEFKTRMEARYAAFPEYVWLTAQQGHPSQVTREHALELVEAGSHELVTAPTGDQPTDLVWVRTKLAHAVQVTREKAIELLNAGTHRLAEPEA